MSEAPAIRLQNVSFAYEGTDREILHGIDLEIKKGEFVTVIGPNGAGKTTLVRTMIGLNRPSSGTVTVEGKDLSTLTIAQLAKTVGFLFQNPDHQLFEDTVYDEIASGPRNAGYTEEEIARIVEKNMEFCGLENLKVRAPENLSIGEKKRVAVAAIMAMDTDIIVLDEPTTGQTWANLKPLLPVIERLNANGKTVIMITHDVDLIVKYSSRVVVVLDGRIVFDGNRDALFQNDDLLKRAHLTKPTIYEISQRLQQKYPSIRLCFEPEVLAEQIKEMKMYE